MPITHADALGRPFVTATKDELGETTVAGLFEREHLQGRMAPGKNLLFSSAFALAWEEVARVGGSTILMQYDPPVCVGMQGDKDYKNDLEASAWFAGGNYGSAGVLTQTREALTEKFNGVAVPTLLPDNVEPEHLFAYAYMFKYVAYNTRDGAQAMVATGPRPEDFILDLPLASTDDRLLVASLEPAETLAETVDRVVNTRAPFTASGMHAAWALESHRVPKMHFDITWKFRNTSARYVLKVDEHGVTVLSEAAQMTLPLPPIIVARPGGRAPVPVLLILTKRSRPRPYFAAWIESTELLIPDATG